MVSTAGFSRGYPSSILVRVIIHQFVNSDIVNFLLKINDARYGRPNFAIWIARKYENHSSIIKIKSSVETTQLFDFNFVSSDDISKIINSMDPTKKTSGAIPTKIVKLANKQICKDLANCINECIKQNKFPNKLKIADITPTFKKDDQLDKTNYRPISILPTVSKIFERILFNQL